ncbi:hypothetical protein B738_29121, partial [Photorhabdus temperata subsp. temperata M1021]
MPIPLFINYSIYQKISILLGFLQVNYLLLLQNMQKSSTVRIRKLFKPCNESLHWKLIHLKNIGLSKSIFVINIHFVMKMAIVLV